MAHDWAKLPKWARKEYDQAVEFFQLAAKQRDQRGATIKDLARALQGAIHRLEDLESDPSGATLEARAAIKRAGA